MVNRALSLKFHSLSLIKTAIASSISLLKKMKSLHLRMGDPIKIWEVQVAMEDQLALMKELMVARKL